MQLQQRWSGWRDCVQQGAVRKIMKGSGPRTSFVLASLPHPLSKFPCLQKQEWRGGSRTHMVKSSRAPAEAALLPTSMLPLASEKCQGSQSCHHNSAQIMGRTVSSKGATAGDCSWGAQPLQWLPKVPTPSCPCLCAIHSPSACTAASVQPALATRTTGCISRSLNSWLCKSSPEMHLSSATLLAYQIFISWCQTPFAVHSGTYGSLLEKSPHMASVNIHFRDLALPWRRGLPCSALSQRLPLLHALSSWTWSPLLPPASSILLFKVCRLEALTMSVSHPLRFLVVVIVTHSVPSRL